MALTLENPTTPKQIRELVNSIAGLEYLSRVSNRSETLVQVRIPGVPVPRDVLVISNSNMNGTLLRRIAVEAREWGKEQLHHLLAQDQPGWPERDTLCGKRGLWWIVSQWSSNVITEKNDDARVACSGCRVQLDAALEKGLATIRSAVYWKVPVGP